MSHSSNMYLEGTDIIEIKISDCTGRRIMTVRSNSNDEKEIANLFNLVITKYGLSLKVVSDKNEELKWLNSDGELKW